MNWRNAKKYVQGIWPEHNVERFSSCAFTREVLSIQSTDGTTIFLNNERDIARLKGMCELAEQALEDRRKLDCEMRRLRDH